jgi:hypothetical protein
MRSDAVDLHDEASAEYDAAFDWYLCPELAEGNLLFSADE